MTIRAITISQSEVADAIKRYVQTVYNTPIGAVITVPRNLNSVNVTIATKDASPVEIPDFVIAPQWDEPQFRVDDRVLIVPVTAKGGVMCERFGYIMRVKMCNGQKMYLQACVKQEVGKLAGKPGRQLEGRKRQEVMHSIPQDTNDPERSVRVIKVYPFLTTDKINIKEACEILKEHIDLDWI
jgi:hypothetical protein